MSRIIAAIIAAVAVLSIGWWGWNNRDELLAGSQRWLPGAGEQASTPDDAPPVETGTKMDEPALPAEDSASQQELPAQDGPAEQDADEVAEAAAAPKPTPAPVDEPLPEETGSAMAIEIERVAEATISAADARARAEATARAEAKAREAASAQISDAISPLLSDGNFAPATIRDRLASLPAPGTGLEARIRDGLRDDILSVLDEAEAGLAAAASADALSNAAPADHETADAGPVTITRGGEDPALDDADAESIDPDVYISRIEALL
ncbi:hypothetical protein [Paracoccus sediminicola]|uniref:hypothetical protein n=1 Tax=Paracoccus sediminicola TaxID=3017783 RepID=UPI0022F100BC|nr:hypothetical protein [Paracoccus sediminicola]WBU55478.1 hypothetical protein PAF18_08025 [Paracoccus sediminicola]